MNKCIKLLIESFFDDMDDLLPSSDDSFDDIGDLFNQ